MIKQKDRSMRLALLKHFKWSANATDEAAKDEAKKAVTSLGTQVRVYLTNPGVFAYLHVQFGAAATAVLAGSQPGIGPQVTPAQATRSMRGNNARLARERHADGTIMETGVTSINMTERTCLLRPSQSCM
jgi:hypothetical protein